MIQVIQTGESSWEVHRVSEVMDDAWLYKLLGRIVDEGGVYHVEFPLWQDIGYAWNRKPGNGRAVYKAALRDLVEHHKRAS